MKVTFHFHRLYSFKSLWRDLDNQLKLHSRVAHFLDKCQDSHGGFGGKFLGIFNIFKIIATSPYKKNSNIDAI